MTGAMTMNHRTSARASLSSFLRQKERKTSGVSLRFRNLFLIAVLLVATSAIAAESNRAADPFALPSKTSPEVQWWRDSRTNLDERLAWFRDARFGMFMHWGVYSSLGNEFHGRRGGGYAEHIQRV